VFGGRSVFVGDDHWPGNAPFVVDLMVDEPFTYKGKSFLQSGRAIACESGKSECGQNPGKTVGQAAIEAPGGIALTIVLGHEARWWTPPPLLPKDLSGFGQRE